MGDHVRVDIKKGLISNLTTNVAIQIKPLPDFIMAVLDAGTLNEYIVSKKSEYKLLK
jgi:3-isopropylmalate dehydratase small subunit